jgi:uncharacterized membrane protein
VRKNSKITRQRLVDILNDSTIGLPKEERLNFGQRLADRVASIGGSWGFIISFFVFLVAWITVNSIRLFLTFDPYPFILLNLILSCIAAIQAPFIMMSQRRLDERDREITKTGLRIDIKTASDIEMLNGKLDRLTDLLDIEIVKIDGYGK